MIEIFLQIFIYITIGDVILSYFPGARNQEWGKMLHKIAYTPQKPIRDLLPQNLPFDPTPMIIIIICQMLMFIF